MSTRVYLPTTSSGLAGLVADRGWPGPLRGHAVTDALRAEWPDGDDEQWEYAALMAAADDCQALRGEGDLPRRYVVAADVADVRPVPGDDPTAVEVAAGVTWRAVAAAHVDTEDDLVGSGDGDDDLAWFATQEIPDLV
jgi:hypothetical protein